MRKLTVLNYAILVLMTFGFLLSKTCVHAIFSSGAKDESCLSLLPPGVAPQDSNTNPYSLTVYKEKSSTVVETYYWNETLTVTIASYPDRLRGILLQARSVGSTNAVGEFVNIQDGFQYLGCSGSPTGTITNTDDSRFYKVSFYWTAGGLYLGDIEFLVTVGNTEGDCWTFGSGVISVNDDTQPDLMINCPADILVTSLPSSNGNNVSWSSSHCSNKTGHSIDVTCNETNHQFAAISPAKTVQCWCTSRSGSVATCDFQYTVQDITPPVISNCPNETEGFFFYLPNNQNKAHATWTEPHAFDNSGNDVIVSNTGGNNGDPFSLGTTTVSYTFSDSSGNSNQCIFNVTVLDNIPPVISECEFNNRTVYKYLPIDENVINVTWAEPFATDNSAMDVELNKTGGRNGDLFTLGTTSVEYIFRDTSGNSAQCKFDVTVLDITPPVVIDWEIQNGTKLEAYLPDDASEVAVSWSEPRVADNSNGVVNISQTGGRSGDLFPLGNTTVRYFFTDASGNNNQYLFYINVNDVTPPDFTCPHHNEVIRAYLPPIKSKVIVSWIEPSATDNSREEIAIFNTGGSNGDEFYLGDSNITYTFTDRSGNSDQCAFHVLVLGRLRMGTMDDDVTPPEVHNCDQENNSLEVYLPPDDNKVIVTWTEPTATDNSGMFVIVTHTGGGSGDLFPLGRSTVRYTFTDSSGNNQICFFDVLVIDVTPPVIINCLSDSGGIEASLPSNNSHVIISWRDPFATDNSAVGVNMTLSGGQNGGIYYSGKTDITYTFTDASGNQNQCIFNVTVVDATPPVVVNCPSDIRVPLPSNSSTVNAMWKAPSVSDNTGEVVRLVQSGGNVGDLFPLGVTTVTYKFYDSSDNYNQCSFEVIVRDVTGPVISNCPIVIIASTCSERENVAWLEPTATDNSKRSVKVKTSENPGDAFTVGNHTVIYTFEDESGNTALCSFLVWVEKKTHCTHHTSYIIFVAIGFYLLLVCLAIALCAFLLYRRKRNASQYTISSRYQTLAEPEFPHSTAIELNSIRNTGETVIDHPGTFGSLAATGGIDPDLFNSGYVDIPKTKKFYDG